MSPRISSHSARRRSSPWVSIVNLVYFLIINASLFSWNATHSIVICLTIVLVLGRLKIVESLERILAPRLHSVSNGTTHFRVLIGLPADTSGGWAGINIVSMISSVAYLLELIVHTFLLRAMCSNRVILTLEQQVDVLEEFVRDNRVEVNFTLATNGMDNGASNDRHTDIRPTVDSIVHWQWHCIKQAANAIIMHHARLLQAPAECWLTCTHAHTHIIISTYTHYINTLLVYKVFRI